MPQPIAGAIVQDRLPWRRITFTALIPWAVTRIAYIILGAIAARLPQQAPAQGTGFFAVWQRFDTNWYLSIATRGYYNPQQVAFFPLYPALIRVLSIVLGGNSLLAALVVANLSTLTAMVAIGALAAWEMRDEGAARWAILALMIYPFSFFLATAYTEGLFLTFATLCLLFARQGRWRAAVVSALLAGATRPTGVALIAPLAWEWLRQHGLLQPEQWRGLLQAGRAQVAQTWLGRLWGAARSGWSGLLAVAAVPAFIVGLAIFAGLRFHHPLLIVNVRRDYWGLVSAPVWRTIPREIIHMVRAPFGSDPQIVMALDVAALTVATAGVIALARRTPMAYTLYLLGLLYLCVAQPAAVALQVLQGPGRYLLASSPLFIALGSVLKQHPRVRVVLIALGVALQLYLAVRFLTGKLIE
jgi:hypothetical protein